MGARPCRGPFPLFVGTFFSMWSVLFFLFRCYFLRVAVIFSPYVENFLGLSTVHLAKNSHAFATRVDPNMLPWGNLGEIARLNRFVKTFWSTYFHIMCKEPMK